MTAVISDDQGCAAIIYESWRRERNRRSYRESIRIKQPGLYPRGSWSTRSEAQLDPVRRGAACIMGNFSGSHAATQEPEESRTRRREPLASADTLCSPTSHLELIYIHLSRGVYIRVASTSNHLYGVSRCCLQMCSGARFFSLLRVLKKKIDDDFCHV